MRPLTRFPLIAGFVFLVASIPVMLNPSALVQGGSPYVRIFGHVFLPFELVSQHCRSLAAAANGNAPSERAIGATALLLTFLCWVTLAFLAGLIFAFANSRHRKNPPNRFRIPYFLFLLGLAGNVGCMWFHVCMDGHMHHPPYGVLHYLMDLAWVGAFVAAAVGGFTSRIRFHTWWFWLILVLILCRFPYGSLGGRTGLFELLVLLFLVVLPVLSFRKNKLTTASSTKQ